MLDVPCHSQAPSVAAPAQSLLAKFRAVRARSRLLAAGLSAEDAALQSMPDASPAKWHLAHTTWFFEQFVLGAEAGYVPVHPRWDYLFNSYYQSVGPMHARPQRGLLSRPGFDEVLAYRHEVEARIGDLLARSDDPELLRRITLGLHHEQQHQELLLTDIKHLFSLNPLEPAFKPAPLQGSMRPCRCNSSTGSRAFITSVMTVMVSPLTAKRRATQHCCTRMPSPTGR